MPNEQTPDCNCRARVEASRERSVATLRPTVYMPYWRAKELFPVRRLHESQETATR
jgi:hypothetical protein